MAFAVLPEDIFIGNILVRLPVKSVGRSRCVSKPWRHFLSSPQFLKAHFRFHLDNPPENCLFLTDHYSPDVCICTDINGGNGCVSNKVTHVPHLKNHVVLVEGSCHGLLLLSVRKYRDDIMVLFNPITLDSEKITEVPRGRRFFMSGLGYDRLNDDFKVVSVTQKEEKAAYSVQVYSVKTKVWTKAGNSGYQFYNHRGLDYGDGYSGMFLNGCVHWLAYDPDNVIAAFSMAREEFDTVHPPEALSLAGIDSTMVMSVIGGCLTIFMTADSSTCAEVWMMKEYGVNDSWTKFNIVFPAARVPRSGLIQPYKLVCFLGDDEIVVLMPSNYKQLAAYNVRNGSWRRDLVIAGLPLYFLSFATPFTSSLASPSCNRIEHE